LKRLENKIKEDDEKVKQKDQKKILKERKKVMFNLFRNSSKLQTKISSILTIFEETEDITEQQEKESILTDLKIEEKGRNNYNQESTYESDDDYGVFQNKDVQEKNNVNLESSTFNLLTALNKNHSMDGIKTFKTELPYDSTDNLAALRKSNRRLHYLNRI
jgi:hypothetical protein